jgi:hypothetical protein
MDTDQETARPIVTCPNWRPAHTVQGAGRCALGKYYGLPPTRACVEWCDDWQRADPAAQAAAFAKWAESRRLDDHRRGTICGRCTQLAQGIARTFAKHSLNCPLHKEDEGDDQARAEAERRVAEALAPGRCCCGQ